jgi:protein-tyrosine phosphatase
VSDQDGTGAGRSGVVIAASLMCVDRCNLGAGIDGLQRIGVDALHFGLKAPAG